MIKPFSLVDLSMSHGIKDNKIYKGTNTSAVIGGVIDGKIYKGTNRSAVIGGVKDSKIYKGTNTSSILKINSTIHSAIKDSKNYDLALMAAAYHFLIKPIF